MASGYSNFRAVCDSKLAPEGADLMETILLFISDILYKIHPSLSLSLTKTSNKEKY
jgi:hypothetical protein